MTPPANPFDVVIAEIPRYLLVFSVVLLASLILTPLMRSLGLRYGWTGRAAARNIHTRPTPRVGGIAMYVGLALYEDRFAVTAASFAVWHVLLSIAMRAGRRGPLFGKGSIRTALGAVRNLLPGGALWRSDAA